MDAFAGLAWDASKPANPQNKTLGAHQQRQLTPSQSLSANSSNVDLFGKLASAGQPLYPSRSATSSTSPAPNGTAIPSRPGANAGNGNSSGADPFGGLFARGGSPNINMSMADRRAHADRERRERERREKEKLESQGAMWDQLDGALGSFSSNSNANSRTASPSPAILGSQARATPPVGLKTNPNQVASKSPPTGTDLFWSMHHPPTQPTPSSRTTSPAVAPQRPTPSTRTSGSMSSSLLDSNGSHSSQKVDAWSQLDMLAAPKAAPAASSAAVAAMDPFDLDFLASPVLGPTSAPTQPFQPTPPLSRTRTPGDFDFDEQDGGSSTDDDILGDLAKPVERRATPEHSAAGALNSNTRQASTRGPSPPPHIIGRIVEMGFTPQQARVALAATDTGIDVEAALDSLLAAGGEDVTAPEVHREREVVDLSPRTQRTRPSNRQQQELSDGSANVPAASRASGTSTPSGGGAGLAGQLQADKLLAQASEIGFSMFTKANAFWNSGKEAVQKAYEENVAKAASTTGTPNPGDGRPKWMTADMGDTSGEDSRIPRARGAPRQSGGFRDEEGDSPVVSSFTAERSRETEQAAKVSAPSAPSRSARNLLFEDEGAAYISPHRRKAQSSNVASPSNDVLMGMSSSSSAPASRRPAPSPRPAARPAVSRLKINVPDTSPSIIASCITSRTKGTELFKLGQYGDADSAYTIAITSLPPDHILLASLYTNRAAARLKTGDSGGAVGDCTNVFKLMGIGEDMAGLMDIDESQAITISGVPGKVNLQEQAVKALQRRASGLEMMERWDKARADWERLAGLSWSPAQGRVKDDATRNAARCRTMVGSAAQGKGGDSAAPPRSKPKPRSAPARSSGPSRPSEAAKRLKEADVALEAEENEKIQLKDSVDARIQTWKGGKEANVRALIASLETVLWPELGWVKVGMHELVTPSQVKIRYTKAIAKVHPDKLKSGNTTVEQRMLANGVFAGLNEAWGAFQQ